MNKLRIHECMREEYGVNLYRPYSSQAHPLQRGVRKMCVRMPRDISAHIRAQPRQREYTMDLYILYSPQKNALAPVHARLCNRSETSLPWKLLRTYLESCASIVQAAVCRPPLLARRNLLPDRSGCRLPTALASSTKSAARQSSLKRSFQIHVSS